jgi:hypothetical protein
VSESTTKLQNALEPVRKIVKTNRISASPLWMVLIVMACSAALGRSGTENGFCCPQGGYDPFGQPSYSKPASPAIDYDGDP